MVWKILDNKTWEDIPERSVFWLYFISCKPDTTKYKVQKFIEEFKINLKYKNKMLRLKDSDKYPVHIKYISGVI